MRALLVLYLIILGAAVSLLMSINLSRAQKGRMCQPIAQLAQTLKDGFQEVPIWGGTTLPSSEGGSPFETIFFQSPKNSWSVVVVQKGVGCIVAAGIDGTPIYLGRGA
jgi:hypothetical protein